MSDLFRHAGDLRARLVLGTLHFGTSQDRDTSFALLDAFAAEGGRLVDTAHVYGDWDRTVPPGASERMIGAWLASRGARGDIRIATKIGHPALDDPATSRLDPESLRTDVEQARENLGLETIPLVYLHRDNERVPIEDLLGPLESFLAEGLIGAYGASNWTARRLRESRQVAQARGWAGFAANQPGWGLARPNPEASTDGGMVGMDDALYRFHEESGMPVSPYSSQSKGYFSRWARGADDPVVRLFDGERNRSIAQRLDELARIHGVPSTELSVAVLLASPFPTFPVIGTGSVQQLRSSFRATTVRLSPDELDAVLGEHPAY
jgi:aryl-alcohol dehydrogenase-like predicted oxidoreductase